MRAKKGPKQQPERRLGNLMARIMIVDDFTDSCKALEKFLELAGHDVDCVPNGREALAHILNKLPDAVLLDLMMPEMDGPTFLEVVRSYLRLQSLPVVVLTALADSPMVARVRALRVNSILVKGKASSEDIQKALEEAIVRVPV
jgi:CheY-like chemotaxis protein